MCQNLRHLKIINFPFETNGKFIIFRCSNTSAHYGNSRLFFYFSKNYPESLPLLYIGNSCIISPENSEWSITSAL